MFDDELHSKIHCFYNTVIQCGERCTLRTASNNLDAHFYSAFLFSVVRRGTARVETCRDTLNQDKTPANSLFAYGVRVQTHEAIRLIVVFVDSCLHEREEYSIFFSSYFTYCNI